MSPHLEGVVARFLGSASLPNELFGILEGREQEFAEGVVMLFRTLAQKQPYEYEHNDALIKLHLEIIQFAKDRGTLEEFVAHDVKTMSHVNNRIRGLIQTTGQLELAAVTVAELSSCHFHMVTGRPVRSADGLRRSWVSPYKRVLDAGSAIGQFDFTEQFVHENYTVPRLKGYARDLGVEFDVSEWNPDTREVWVEVRTA